MKNELSIRTIAEIGIMVALAAVLSLLPLFTMPNGGEISLSMVPILFLAFYRGPTAGILAGVVFGFVYYPIHPFFAHPAQVLLDYPIAFGLVGVAGFFGKDSFLKVTAGTITGGFARFLAHLLSGVIFFASYAPEGQNVWLYSAIYNSSYMPASTVIAIPIVYALLRAFGETGGK